MPQWTKRIFRGRRGGKGTSSDVTEGSDDKVPKFLDQIEILPKVESKRNESATVGN